MSKHRLDDTEEKIESLNFQLTVLISLIRHQYKAVIHKDFR